MPDAENEVSPFLPRKGARGAKREESTMEDIMRLCDVVREKGSEPYSRGQPPGRPDWRNCFSFCVPCAFSRFVMHRRAADGAVALADVVFAAGPLNIKHPTSNPENRFAAEEPQENDFDKLA